MQCVYYPGKGFTLGQQLASFRTGVIDLDGRSPQVYFRAKVPS